MSLGKLNRDIWQEKEETKREKKKDKMVYRNKVLPSSDTESVIINTFEQLEFRNLDNNNIVSLKPIRRTNMLITTTY